MSTTTATQTTLHTAAGVAWSHGDEWRPTLSDGVWMNASRDRWLSQRRSTGTWTVTDADGNEYAEYRPDHFTVVTGDEDEAGSQQHPSDCGYCAAGTSEGHAYRPGVDPNA